MVKPGTSLAHTPRKSPPLLVFAFSLAIFFGAALLFAVEPMAANIMLPRFGGSAAIWTASLFFFQTALLAGYGYAHVTRLLQAKWQALIHVIVFGALIFLFPTHLPHSIPSDKLPAFHVLLSLAELCGIPFFLLAAGAPLLQNQFAHSDDAHANDPYFLYAASNVGSLLGLLTYPFLIQPYTGLHAQIHDWSFLVKINWILLAIVLIPLVLRKKPQQSNGTPVVSQEELLTAKSTEAISTKQVLLWIALAALPSSLLLGVTTYLTTNVAPIPLLWVIPLGLYLITFIAAFAKNTKLKATELGRFVPLIVTPLAIAVILESSQPLIPLAIFHLAAVFLLSISCHRRLAESRPHTTHLTAFYLWIAVGGAIGGVFNAIIAPLIFHTLFEYPLAIALASALVVSSRDPKTPLKPIHFIYPFLVLFLTVGITFIAKHSGLAASPARTLLTIGLPAILCFLISDRPVIYGFSLAALFIGASIAQTASNGTIVLSARSFYGVHRVIYLKKDHFMKLVHGTTTHGIESTIPSLRDVPLTYYTKSGPIGQLFSSLNHQGWKQPVALVGMGVGSLAAYGVPNQQMTYFEIDPDVIYIATKSGLFHFIGDCKAHMSIVEGDGRIMLSQQPDHHFGLIVLDAFTSDSIPLQMLTEEAIQMYFTKLRRHGVIAFHISNRYLNLAPILSKEAEDLHVASLYEDDSIISPDQLAAGTRASQWMILARNQSDLTHALGKQRFNWSKVKPANQGWTDDYSNILAAFKIRALSNPG